MLILIAIVIEVSVSITIVNTFADRLLFARNMRRLTQAELARACGMSQSAIANYENGSRRSPKSIFALADALQVQAQWLAEGKGGMEAPPYNAPHPAGSAKQPPHPAHTLSEPLPILAPWPFPKISPDTYWSLDSNARLLIENTVGSLITSLKK